MQVSNMIHATIEWNDTEKTILILEVRADNWDWDDSFALMRDFKAKAESVEHSIYTVIIFHDTPPTPDSAVFRNVRQITKLRPKNEVLTVFVGTNSLFRTIFNTVNKIYLLKNIFDSFRFVATKDQAIALIHEEKAKALARNS